MPSLHSRRPVIGIMGAGESAAPADVEVAESLGRLVAERGWIVLTGGRDAGVMAAACRGAKKVPGSLTVGILPGDSSPVSPQVDVAIFTGMGMARNAVNVLSSDVVVACGAGGAGTASEVAFALKAGKPLVLLRPTPAAVAFHESLGTGFFVASTPEEAVALIESRRLTDLRAPPPC